MTFTWPNNVTLPVSLYGLIPGGTAFQVPIPQSSSETSYGWNANIAQGTDVILLMADGSSAQTGGSTSLLEVGQGSTECMNDTSPSAGAGGTGSGTATGSGPSASVSGVGGTSGGGSGQGNNGGGNGGGGSSTPTGAIVGGTLGGVAFIVLLAILLFFFLKRRSRERRESNDSSLLKNYGMSGHNAGTEKRSRFDILAGGASRRDGGLGRAGSDSEARATGEEYQPSPFRYPSPPPGSVGGRNPVPPSSFAAVPPMAASKEAESRPSFESGNTTTQDGSTPFSTSIGAATGSQAGRTDDATVGHGHGTGVQRGASTRKTGVPPSPTVNTGGPRRGVDEVPSDDGARIVQHQDEGPVV